MMKWELGERVQTRDAYGEALLELGKQRQDVVVLDSDLQRSNKTYDFGQSHPERFFDMGIAEADMVCTAAGMAATGMTVFATSFAMFVPGRAYDQIRLQLSYAQENVKIVGVSAGPVGLFGKAGVVFWDASASREYLGSVDDSGTDLAWGAGVRAHWGRAEFRVEYETFDVDLAEQSDMVSFGFAWNF